MQFALILTVCATLATGGEHCTDRIEKVRDTLPECLHLMDAQPKQPNDRYYSCGLVQPAADKFTTPRKSD